LRRGSAIAGAIALLVCCTLGSGTAFAAESGCAQAAAMADTTTLRQASHSVLCLVNGERARRGLAPLRASRLLDRTARAHSRDMVARKYFSHVTPNGVNARQRIARSGYLYKRSGCKVGETIAWGSERQGTPAELVRLFMTSTGHRRALLDRGYRDIGVGLALGAPISGVGDGATLTLDFGRR
jgi:uncharacterized protein YkwD